MAIIKAGKLTGSAKEQQLLGIKSKDKAAVPESPIYLRCSCDRPKQPSNGYCL